MVLCKDKQLDHLNRIKSSEIDPHINDQLIYEKSDPTMKWRKLRLF